MKQISKLLGRFIISRPLGLFILIAVCSLVTAQLVIFTDIYLAFNKSSILPSSVKTIMVFVGKNPSSEDIDRLKLGLSGLDEVEKVIYIPSKDGLDRLRAWLGKDSAVISDINENMLPDAFAVVLKDRNLPDADKAAEVIWKMPMVSEVRYNNELIRDLSSLLERLSGPARYFAFVYILCLCLIIFYSVRLRLVKHVHALLKGNGAMEYNAAILLEGIFYILIFSVAGNFLASAALNYTAGIVTEIRSLLPDQSLKGTLISVAAVAFFCLAAVVFSLKVRE